MRTDWVDIGAGHTHTLKMVFSGRDRLNAQINLITKLVCSFYTAGHAKL